MKKIILLALFITTTAWGESIELATGEVIDGKLLDFPKNVTVELSDGTKKVIPYHEIISIFKKNAPQVYTPFLTKDGKKTPLDKAEPETSAELDTDKGPYGTPALTFETWKKAAIADDMDGMVNCYVDYRKSEVKKQLKKLSKKTREQMKMAMMETIFTPNQTYYQGEMAMMEVSWTKGMASETQTLKFKLENNKEWKIVE